MSATSDPPRRKHRRLTLRIDVEVCVGDDRVNALATTLGAGGLFIATDSPLAPSTPLRVRFRLPGSRQLHDIEAKVVWANDAATAGVPLSARGMGVAFTDRDGQAALARALAAWGCEPPVR